MTGIFSEVRSGSARKYIQQTQLGSILDHISWDRIMRNLPSQILQILADSLWNLRYKQITLPETDMASENGPK